MTQELSAYSMGWLMVMFDLPVTTKRERKAASDFRNVLLDDGYVMLQYSVYARSCPNFEYRDKHLAKLKPRVPHGGNVRIFYITDRQWLTAITIAGEDYYSRRWEASPDSPQQMLFWE